MNPILLAATLALAASACPTDFGPFRASIEAEMKMKGVPGAAAAVVCSGRVAFAEGFGLSSVETKTAVTPDTLFRLGSTSKVFSALAVLRLAESGRLKLDEPLGAYTTGLAPPLTRLTARQLLSHTAGLKDDAPMDGPHDESALAANVRSWTAAALMAPPGRVFSYANTGYVLAGYLIESVTGKRFADAIDELVLKPAGMQHSTYRPLLAMTYPLAVGHLSNAAVSRPMADHAGAWPPGSLFSSAADLGRFLSHCMHSGAGEMLSQPLAAIDDSTSYGHGVVIRQEAGRKFVSHLGNRTGYSSLFDISLSDAVGVVILSNRQGAPLTRSARTLLGLPPVPVPPAEPPASELSPPEAAELAGRYVNNGPILAELAVRDGKLVLLAAGKPFPVVRTGADSYRAPGAGQLTRFRISRAPDGRPEFLLAEYWALAKEVAR